MLKNNKKVAVSIILYIILTAIFGIIRSNVILANLILPNERVLTIVLYTSSVITSIFAGLLLAVIFISSWYSTGIFKIDLTKEKYLNGLVTLVVTLTACEILKFINAVLFLPQELQSFNNGEDLMSQFKSSVFLRHCNLLDYGFYVLGCILLYFDLYERNNKYHLMILALVILFFLLFTKTIFS